PYRRLAQALLVETAVLAQFEHGIRPKLCPARAVGRAGDTQALPARAILAQIEKIEVRAGADHIGIGHAALIPASARAGIEYRVAFLRPLAAIHRTRQTEPRQIHCASDVPIPELAVDEERRAVRRDVAAFPGSRIGRK